MSKARSVREAMQAFANNKFEEPYPILCKVDSVDEAKRTATLTPQKTGAKVLGARLQASVEISKGVVCYPVLGSLVLCAFIEGANTGFIVKYSEFDKILIDSDTEEGAIQINGGSNGGLINIEPLVDKISSLEKDLNELKNIFATWVVSPMDGGAALKTSITAAWTGQPFAPVTTRKDLEDKAVTH